MISSFFELHLFEGPLARALKGQAAHGRILRLERHAQIGSLAVDFDDTS